MSIRAPDGPDHFAFILPPDKAWFSPKEAATLIGRTDQYIRDSFENQKIFGHMCNGRARRGRELRRSYQIHRDAIILFLLETANYRPNDFLERLCEVLRNRSPRQITQIQQFLTACLKNAHLR